MWTVFQAPWIYLGLVLNLLQVFFSESTQYELCTVSERTKFSIRRPKDLYDLSNSSCRVSLENGVISKTMLFMNLPKCGAISLSLNCVCPCSCAVIMNADDGVANWTWINMYTFFSFHINMLFIPWPLWWTRTGGGNAPLKIQLPQGERKVLQLFGPALNGLFAEQIAVWSCCST